MIEHAGVVVSLGRLVCPATGGKGRKLTPDAKMPGPRVGAVRACVSPWTDGRSVSENADQKQDDEAEQRTGDAITLAHIRRGNGLGLLDGFGSRRGFRGGTPSFLAFGHLPEK